MTRRAEYLEAAADRVMIKDLLARYAWEIDHGTPEGFAAVFAEDGVFEVSALKLWVKGTTALAQFARSLQRTLPNVHHVMSNFVIDVSGDRARGCCELNEFMARRRPVIPEAGDMIAARTALPRAATLALCRPRTLSAGGNGRPLSF